jgi:hypothetical protein
MTRVKLIATACITAALMVVNAAAAQDFNTNERTYLTFSAPVELPGVTLQPGTYLFRLADSASNRHIIQVLSQDEKQMHATILAVPAERMEVSGENVVTFKETAEGTTPAVQYWYYPGDKIGHEFVYPKDQAMKIARRTRARVLSTEGDISANSTVSSMDPEGNVTDWQREGRTAATTPEPAAPAAAPESQVAAEERTAQERRAESEPAAQAQPAPTPAPEPQAVGTSGARDEELPRTASPLPLSALIGLFSLGGALTVRSLRRR